MGDSSPIEAKSIRVAQASEGEPSLPESQRGEEKQEKDKTNRPLKLISWNSNGIIHKIAELEDFIHRHDPDVIAIQETFLQPCHNFSLPNYTTHRNDRLSHRGGGTAILIKRTIAHHSLDLRTHTLENTTIVIEGAKKLTISCIYRPPSSPAQAIVPDLLRIFRNRTCCIVLGDFNAKHKSWNPHSRGSTCGAQLHKFSKDCGYLITAPAEPTTVPHSARSIPSTLDFAISCGLSDIRVETHVDLSSDHNPVQFSIKSSPKPYTQNCTAFTNWNLFQELLTTSIQGNPVISDTDDIESKISQFTSNIHQAINQSSKFKVITHDITFIPQALRLKITEKNKIRKLWQSTRFPPLKQTLNNLQRQIKCEMKSAKKNNGLLYKMIKLNFPSYIIHLVNSYLSDRTFQVKILATLSRIGTVSAGSPQGSILSPLLYNIYTHDFPTTPTVDVCLFADDAAIIAQACNPDMVRRYLQQYLKKLQSWLRKWRIKINVGKSQAIIFKKGQYRNRLRELKLFRNSIPLGSTSRIPGSHSRL
ncbi:probable RNA-directed DNA polymerase from transposon X-element [Trichonephila clavipes]|nr:probable RNA-directed DNA polymerase from transposon X-element [Trichonephila clavipes]